MGWLWFYFLIPTFFFNESILSPKTLTDGNPNFAWMCLVTKISTWQGSICTFGWWQLKNTYIYICSPSIFTHNYTKTDSIFKDAADTWLENSVTHYTSKTKEMIKNEQSFLSIKHAPCLLGYHSAHLIWSDPQIFAWITSLQLLLD